MLQVVTNRCCYVIILEYLLHASYCVPVREARIMETCL